MDRDIIHAGGQSVAWPFLMNSRGVVVGIFQHLMMAGISLTSCGLLQVPRPCFSEQCAPYEPGLTMFVAS